MFCIIVYCMYGRKYLFYFNFNSRSECIGWYKTWEAKGKQSNYCNVKTKHKERGKEYDLLQMIFGRKIAEYLWNDSISPQENPNHSGDVKQ